VALVFTVGAGTLFAIDAHAGDDLNLVASTTG